MSQSPSRSSWRSAVRATLKDSGLEAPSDDHVSVASWILGQERAHRPWFVGMSGPQGAGKSTLAHSIHVACGAAGLRSAVLSIDDFYLTNEEQQALAHAHPDNRYLEHRGYPGTHDIDLGMMVLTKLRAAEQSQIALPRYDKSARSGRGDRAAAACFPMVALPLDVVVFEGWMLGFEPVANDQLEDARLVAPNQALADYLPWWKLLDAMIVMVAPSLEAIVRWRIDAEARRRHQGQAALDPDQARDYIQRFLPAYRSYVPSLVDRTRHASCGVIIELADDRRFAATHPQLA